MIDLKQNEDTAVLIDGTNLHYTAKSINLVIDYKRLRDLFRQQSNLLRIFFYSALESNKSTYDPVRALVDFLQFNGYTVVSKPVKDFTQSDGVRFRKGNMDIEIAIDMIRVAKQVKHIVLFSGDGDFRRLLEEVQHQGARVTVVSSISSIADELRRQCDDFVLLESLRADIERSPEDRKNKPRRPPGWRDSDSEQPLEEDN